MTTDRHGRSDNEAKKIAKTVLGDIAKISSGGTPSRSVAKYWNGNIPWVKTAQIQNCIINKTDVDEWITEEGLKNSSAKMVPIGSIVLGMIGQGKTRGQVGYLNFEACTNQNAATIVCYKKSHSNYIFQYLLFNYQNIRALSNNSGQGNLNLGLVKIIPIMLPPLLEQKAIADLLSTWDKAIEITEQLIQAKEKQFKWLIGELISKPGKKIEKHCGWNAVRLRDLCKVLTSNVDKKTLPNEASVLLCNYMDVYKNYYITPKLNFMRATATSVEVEKFQLKFHDVLLTKDSETPSDIANSACVIDELKNVLCGYHLTILRPGEKIFGPYLNFVLHTPRIRYEFSRQANGATRFGLTLSAYKKIEIQFPSIDKQKEIAGVLTMSQEEIGSLLVLVEKYKNQKRGLMQKILTGEWRVKPEIVRQYGEDK